MTELAVGLDRRSMGVAAGGYHPISGLPGRGRRDTPSEAIEISIQTAT
jgi:hypothetical protein